jgi:hypothetical protein
MTRSARIAIDASLFAAVGPLIGLAALLLYGSIAEAFSSGPYHWLKLSDMRPMLTFSYVFGAIPAAVTGLIWSSLARLSQRVRSFGVGSRGAIGAVLGSAVAIGCITAFDNAAAEDMWQLFGSCGAIAGGVLATLVPPGGLRRVPSTTL